MMSILLVLLGCTGSPPEAPAPPAPPPSVLLVVVDTVRADALSAETTPALWQLSQLGVTYADAHTSGTWSWPSHASMFWGLPPWEHGAHFDRDGVQWGSNDPITVSMPRVDTDTLAERFRDAGYATALITANPWLREGVGLDRGYGVVRYGRSDARVVEFVREGLAAGGDKPLFLTVNLMSAHAPFAAGEGCGWLTAHRAVLDGAELAPWRGEKGLTMTRGAGLHDLGAFAYARGELALSDAALAAFRAAYRCDVHEADAMLGQVLGAWAAAKRGGVIAVTSDHGELLGEHGQWEHGRGIWPELSHVPLVVAAPGRLPAGERVDGTVLLHGIYGTLLELAGIGRPEDARLVPGVPRRVKAWSDGMWATHVGGRFAHDASLYADDGWARVAWGQEEQFFDLRADPTLDAPAVPPGDVAAALRAGASGAFEETTAPRLAPEIDPETRSALEEMGYLEPKKP